MLFCFFIVFACSRYVISFILIFISILRYDAVSILMTVAFWEFSSTGVKGLYRENTLFQFQFEILFHVC